MRKMAVFLLLFAAIMLVMRLHQSPSLVVDVVPVALVDEDGDGLVEVPRARPVDPWDVAIAAIITGSSALCVLALLVGSHRKREWSWQGLGMLGDYLGGTLLYFSILAVGIGLWDRLKTPEWYNDAVRASFLAGCPILAACLVRWMVSPPSSIEDQVETGRASGHAAGLAEGRAEQA
jgi:hypothetical protein